MAYTYFEFNDGPDVRGFQLEAGRVKLYAVDEMDAAVKGMVKLRSLYGANHEI